jgi:hypothetical protein
MEIAAAARSRGGEEPGGKLNPAARNTNGTNGTHETYATPISPMSHIEPVAP